MTARNPAQERLWAVIDRRYRLPFNNCFAVNNG